MAEVILLAGGSGSRMGATVSDKILATLGGKTPFRRCLEAFADAGIGERVIVVRRDTEQQRALAREALDTGIELIFVQGGRERQDSVQNGLAATSEGSHLVFIHDCARPLIRPASIQLVAQAAEKSGAAVLARAVTDTIKRLPETGGLEGVQLEDLDRRRLWAMETPQVFRRDWILEAYARVTSAITDDVAAATAAGYGVTVVPNPWPNPKLTHPEDFIYCNWLLEQAAGT